MIAAITQRTIAKEYGTVRDALDQAYANYYGRFGIALVPIPNLSPDISVYFDLIQIEGIIISGGNDAKEREKTEVQLMQVAIRKKLPVFAQCHGAQFINRYFGGPIGKNIGKKTSQSHAGTSHSISITDSKVRSYLKKKNTRVNSYHDHCILEKNLSSKLRIFAQAPDGTIEGFYHPKLPIGCILWHPERKGSDAMIDKKLVHAFVKRRLFWK